MKVAEHVSTSHQVAVKILNRKKIQSMDMEEKGKGLCRLILLVSSMLGCITLGSL